mmetsp:Transcript_17986/g.35157  ORF Transcript_17986/g.35157 Transcript_17986/m.35157 type:complete len:84 (+) Transcript_17986:404-655(+)
MDQYHLILLAATVQEGESSRKRVRDVLPGLVLQLQMAVLHFAVQRGSCHGPVCMCNATATVKETLRIMSDVQHVVNPELLQQV